MKKYWISLFAVFLCACTVGHAALVAHWTFDNSGDLGADSSGNGHDFSDYGVTPGYSAEGVDGGAAVFDGSASGFQVSGFMTNGSFTAAMWVKPDTWATTSYLLRHWSNDYGFSIYGAWDPAEVVFGILATVSSTTYLRPRYTPATNEWQHLAFSFEASSGPDGNGEYTGTAKAYLDGREVVTVFDAKYAPSDSVNISVGRYASNYYAGLIDDLRIYNKALPDNKVAELAGNSTEAALVARWTFDNSNDLGADSSGNDHDFIDYGITPTYSSAGATNGAAVFDGSSSGFRTGSFMTNGNFTATVWIKPDTWTTASYVLRHWTADAGFNIYGAWATPEVAFAVLASVSSDTYLRPYYTPATNEWQHLAITFEALSGPDGNGEYAGTAKAYVNGRVAATALGAKYKPSDNSTISIGRYGTYYYDGMIDDLRVYKAVLSAVDIAGLAGVDPPLVLSGSDDDPVSPYRGLIYTDADIDAVREEVLSSSSNRRATADRYIELAQEWIDRGTAAVDALLPPDGSVYAYGFAGDPVTSDSWPRYGFGLCDVDLPGEVKSPYTQTIYGIQTSGQQYYDPGDGWVDPSTGTRYYFKGIWNGYIIYQLHQAVDYLSLAYMLTGDERCAELGLHLLDEFAGMRRRNQPEYGVVDYPSDPKLGYGFFVYMGNGANDRMIYSALAFDLLAGSPYAQQPSQGTSGLTVAQNIQSNYFSVLEEGYVTSKNSFQNHAMAAYGASLSQALLFENAAAVSNGLENSVAFLDSCINRDGDYYEVSGSYSQLGRRYGGFLLNLLSKYDPDNYSVPANMPDPEDYPSSLQFGNNSRWYSAAVGMLYRHSVLGRHLQYGDCSSDRDILSGEDSLALTRDRAGYLSLLYHQTTRQDWQESLAQRYWNLPDVETITPADDSVIRFGPAMWLEPDSPGELSGTNTDYSGSDVMPTKALAILRSGEDENRRAFYMRGGAGNSHAHDDQMALTLYGKGMNLTGEYGYYYYGTPDFFGWGTRSIAHNMVVVNEDLPQPSFLHIAPWKRKPPADIEAAVKQGPAQMVEMNNPGMWDDVAGNMQDYRRTAWMVDLSDDEYYFVDIFQIVGGRVHDYAWHSPYLNPQLSGNGFSVSGVSLSSPTNVWVLAALDNSTYLNATYNVPGQAWGERLLGESGQIEDLGIPGEEIAVTGWVPPPGNGYGFIYDIHTGQTTNDWTAQWLMHDNVHTQRLHVLNYDGMTAISGREPSLKKDYEQSVAIARRIQPVNTSTPLQSRFVTVNEIGSTNRFPLDSVERVSTTGTSSEADRIALSVESQDGIHDTILVHRLGGDIETADGVELNGCRGFVRRNDSGEVTDLLLQEGTLIECSGTSLETSASAWQAQITDLDFDEETGFSLDVNQSLPSGERLYGAMAVFSSTGYSCNSYFEVEEIEDTAFGSRLVFEDQQLVMAYLEVEAVYSSSNTIIATYPCELMSLPEINYFNGRYAGILSGGSLTTGSRIVGAVDKKTFILESVSGFSVGDRVAILEVQPGDQMKIPVQITLNRIGEDQYELRTTHDVTVSLPGGEPMDVQVDAMPAGPGLVYLGDLDSGLVAHYSFDSSGTLLNDTSGNGNHLAVYGSSPAYSNTAADSVWTGSASFDGSSQGAQTPSGILPAGSFTASAWARFDSAELYDGIIRPFSQQSGFQISSAWDPVEYAFGIFSSTGGVYLRPRYQIPTGSWHHLAVTFDSRSFLGSYEYSGTVKVYIDGALEDQQEDIVYNADPSNTLCIGRRGNDYFDGAIDEVRIYERALSPVEIAALTNPSVTTNEFWTVETRTAILEGLGFPGGLTSTELCTLIAAPGGNGMISPLNTSIPAGGSATFTITADSWYRIASLTTNGFPVEGASFNNDSTGADFTWSNVRSDGSVSVTFTEQVADTPVNTPYSWLAQYGLTNFEADAADDVDSDGMFTWQEQVAGTDPTDPASVLFVSETAGPNHVVIRWPGVTNRLYSLLWTTNLTEPFTAVPGAQNIPATPPENVYTGSVPAGSPLFYRVNVIQQENSE